MSSNSSRPGSGAARIAGMKPVDQAAGEAAQRLKITRVPDVPDDHEPPAPRQPRQRTPRAPRQPAPQPTATERPRRGRRSAASALAIPEKLVKDKTVPVTVTLKGTTVDRLDALVDGKGGKENGWTRSSMTQYIMEQVLDILEGSS